MNAMDKIMEKVASRKWKEMIGELSSEGRKKLIDSGILNHEKELTGLNKGTENILKKHNVEVHKNTLKDTYKVNKEVSKATGDRLPLLSSISEYLGEKGSIGRTKRDKIGRDHVFLPNSNSNKNEIKNIKRDKFFYDNQDALKKYIDLTYELNGEESLINKAKIMMKNRKFYSNNRKGIKNTETFSKPFKKGSFNQDYNKAILARHEADEIREMHKLNKKVHGAGFGSNYFSHVSPSVLARESANVAVAPTDVANLYKEQRHYSGEWADLKNFGLDYGKPGKHDTKIGKKWLKQEDTKDYFNKKNRRG